MYVESLKLLTGLSAIQDLTPSILIIEGTHTESLPLKTDDAVESDKVTGERPMGATAAARLTCRPRRSYARVYREKAGAAAP